MKVGQIIQVLTDNESPLKSPNTDLVAAWITAGGRLLENGGYEDVYEGDKRFVTWVIDACVKVKIDGEEVEFSTFKNRFLDQGWCEANPDSNIAFLRAFRDNGRDLKQWAKQQATGIRVRSGNSVGVIYPHSSQALKDEFAARFL